MAGGPHFLELFLKHLNERGRVRGGSEKHKEIEGTRNTEVRRGGWGLPSSSNPKSQLCKKRHWIEEGS